MSNDFGTKELMRQTRVKLEPRDISGGGAVINTGFRNEWPDVISLLAEQGMLGDDYDTARRRGDCEALMSLYFSIREHRSQKAMGADMVRGGEGGEQPTAEFEVGNPSDIRYTLWLKTAHALKTHYGLIQTFFLDGATPSALTKDIYLKTFLMTRRATLDAIDAISGAMQRAEKEMDSVRLK